jgi:hypothetical protein
MNDSDENYKNFEQELRTMQTLYFTLPIRDINSERILNSCQECYVSAKKAEELISLSKKKNVKIDLKTLFTLNEFRAFYPESNYFEVFKEIEKMSQHFKVLINKNEDLKIKMNEKKDYLNKYKISQLKTYATYMITIETAHFNGN